MLGTPKLARHLLALIALSALAFSTLTACALPIADFEEEEPSAVDDGDPEQVVDPDQVVDPADPEDPTDPQDPGVPQDPADPQDPGVPQDPAEPADPVWEAQPQSGTVIDIEAGQVEGLDDGNLRVFLGIPYAEPPIGTNRFRPPSKVEPWNGTFPATQFGPACPQADLGDLVLGEGGLSEDCLSLNVWAHDDGIERPVMVFIYGGAFIMGATSQPIYNGAALARRGDVTVVTINYRLGALGWLASQSLADDAGQAAAGNWGVYDQIEALRWVQQNIRAFGGDPDNVTIFGESAGAISVCALLGAPSADDLFHKAIIESGMCALATFDEGGLVGMPSASELAESLIEEVGCADAFDQVDCLRTVPAAELVEATSLGDVLTGDLEAVSALTPVVDGLLIPAQPIDRLRSGAVDKPIIVGSTEDEGLLFTSTDVVLTRSSLRDHIAGFFGEGPIVDELMDVYPAEDFFFPKDAWVALLGEATFICPGLEVAKATADGAPVFTYHFTHVPLALVGVGAMHGLELPYVFDTLDTMGMIATGSDHEVTDALQGAWSSFARHGQPSLASGWDRWTPEAPSIAIIDDDLETTDEIRNGRCQALRELGVVY